MKILIDTNVVIDNLARRDKYAESLQILELCENGSVDGVVTTITVMDIVYILRKYMTSAEIRNAVQLIMQIADVVPVLKSDINAALISDFSDTEDAVQAICSARVKAEYIVTRNVNDFKDSTVPAIMPIDMLALLSPKTVEEEPV